MPPPRKSYPPRSRPAIDPWVGIIDGWLLADREAPRKQRHAARRVWQRLVAEHDATVAEVTVSRHVARRRSELETKVVQVAVPQTHLPGVEAEVDFGDFDAVLDGVSTTCWMFVMRLSHSGRAFHAGPRISVEGTLRRTILLPAQGMRAVAEVPSCMGCALLRAPARARRSGR